MLRLLPVCLALLASGQVSAGVSFVTETQKTSTDGAPRLARIWIRHSSLRLESEPGAAPQRVLLFRGDRRLVWILDPDSRTYQQMDREALGSLRERAERDRRKLDARLARLTPERRQAFERMMRTHAPLLAAPVAPRRLARTRQRDRVNGKPCRIVRILRGGRAVGDVCVADWKTVGLKPLELRVFRKLGELYAELLGFLPAPSVVDLPDEPFEIFGDLSGFPLRVRHIDDGIVVRETWFKEIRHTPIDAERFEIPADYERVELALPGGS